MYQVIKCSVKGFQFAPNIPNWIAPTDYYPPIIIDRNEHSNYEENKINNQMKQTC